MVGSAGVKEGKKGKKKIRVEEVALCNLKENLRRKEGDGNDVIYQVGDTENRYVLWEKGENPLICIGANPSRAGSDDDHPTDPTITRIRSLVKNVSESGGEKFDGWIMLNLYPQRTPFPADLHCSDECDEEMMRENYEAIQTVFDEFKEAKTLLAWGNIIDLKERGYLKESAKKIAILGGDRAWCVRGDFTNKNNPRHQLFVPKHKVLEEVTIEMTGEGIRFFKS